MIRYLFILAAVVASAQTGVAQSGRWIQPPDPNMPIEQRRDIALNAFAVGSAFETSGEPAKALAAYEAALLYDDDPAIHLVAAICAAAAGQADDAAGHLRAASRNNLENPVALRMLADMHVSAEQYDSAASVYRRLVALDSSDEASLDMLAGLLEEHHPDEAIELYRKLMQRSPSSENALNLARLYAHRGSADSAAALLEQVRLTEGDSDMVLQSLAQLAAGRGDWPTAAEHFRSLLVLHPDEPAYELQLAEALLAIDQWAEAASLMNNALMREEVGQSDKLEIGRLFFQRAMEHRDAVSDALKVLTELSRQYPDDWRPLWFLGAVSFNEGDLVHAAAYFTSVLERSPGSTDAANMLARTLLGLERFSEAVDTIEELADAGSATAESWLLLGYAWSSLGREDKAISSLEEALRLDPSNLETLVTLALTYDETGEKERSDPLYERAVRGYNFEGTEKDETYYLLLNNWAYSLATRGLRLDDALGMSAEACEHDPDNGSYLDTRAWVLHMLDRNGEALEFARAALSLRQDSPVLYEHLGDILHALNQRNEARSAWSRSLELQPGNKRIIEFLQQYPATDDH